MNNKKQIGGLRILCSQTYRYPVYQRAGGLGDIFKNLFQSNKATLGNIGKSLLTEGIKTVGKVISDVSKGKVLNTDWDIIPLKVWNELDKKLKPRIL